MKWKLPAHWIPVWNFTIILLTKSPTCIFSRQLDSESSYHLWEEKSPIYIPQLWPGHIYQLELIWELSEQTGQIHRSLQLVCVSGVCTWVLRRPSDSMPRISMHIRKQGQLLLVISITCWRAAASFNSSSASEKFENHWNKGWSLVSPRFLSYGTTSIGTRWLVIT